MPASTPDNLSFPRGRNSAPVQPFLDLKEKKTHEKHEEHPLNKQLRAKYEEKMGERKEEWRDMIRMGRINALFIQGEQLIKINTFSGMPYAVPFNKNKPDEIRAVNQMQYLSTNWQNKWRSSKPDVLIEPYSNNDQAVNQSKKANTVVDYLENNFYSDWFDLQEGLNAQIWGWYGRRVRPDFTAKSFGVFKEILGEKETTIGSAWGACRKCEYKGSDSRRAEDKHLCPKCDSDEFDFDAPVIKKLPHVASKKQIFLPEIVCEPLLFPAVRFDITRKCEHSSWFITEREIETAALKRIIGNIRFPEGESANRFGLEAIEELAARGAALDASILNGAAKREGKVDKTVLTEMFLGADDIYDIRIGGREKTVEGENLPKGKRLSDIYPEGCYVIGTNGMSFVVGIYGNVKHSEEITAGVYHMKAMSGTGRGVDDAVPVQRQWNRRYSQIDRIFATRSSPGTLLPENLISPRMRRMLNNPGADITYNPSQLPEGMTIQNAIYPLQAADVPSGLFESTFNNLVSMLQTTYHVTSFAGGNPRVANDTATGARILDSNSDEVFSPALAIKAEVTVATAKNGFNKFVEYSPFARFVTYKTRTPSGAYGEEISGKDVEGEYRWSYVQGSEAPKSKFSEMDKRVAFFGQFQGGISGWAQVRQQFPKELAEIERDFDVNFETESYDAVGESCRVRFENAKKMIQSAENPDFLQVFFELEPSMEITEANLSEKALWFQALFDQEEGIKASTVERKLIAAFVEAFHGLANKQTIEVQQQAAMVKIESEKPLVEAQQQQQAQAAEAQNAAQAGQQQTQLAAEALKVQNDNEQADAQRAHEAEGQTQESLMRAAEMQHEVEQNAQDRAAQQQTLTVQGE